MAKPKKEKLSFEQQFQKDNPDFASEVAGLSVQDLNNRLAELAKANEWNETKKEEDEDLEKAKGLASELAAPYRDEKKALRVKSKYVIGLIKEKGGK
jgi:hypothetical protein